MAVGTSTSSETDAVDQPNQPLSFVFPNRKFGEKHLVYRSFQSASFKKWPWLHYDQTNDKVYCFVCMKVSKVGNFRVCASKGDDALSLVATLTGRMLVGINEGGLLFIRIPKPKSILLKQQ